MTDHRVSMRAVEAAYVIISADGKREEAVQYLMKWQGLDREEADRAVSAAQGLSGDAD